LGDPKSSEDIPSYKDLVQRPLEKRVPRGVLPKGVKVKTGWGIRAGFLVLGVFLFFVALIADIASDSLYVEFPVNAELKPQQYYAPYVQNSRVGNIIKINVTVLGGNNDIHYYWKDPSGQTHDIGVKVGRIYDVVKADQVGTYYFYFANDMSLITSKKIIGKVTLRNPSLEAILFLTGVTLGIIGVSLMVASLYRKVFISVDGDEIEVHIKPGLVGHYAEIKVNGFKLDEKVGKEGIVFKVGENESRKFELYGEGFLVEQWYFLVDDQLVKKITT